MTTRFTNHIFWTNFLQTLALTKLEKIDRIIMGFRLLRVIVVGFAAIAFASACSREKAYSSQELLYWSANNPYEQEVARAVVKEWNAQHPDMPVHHQPIPEGQSSEEVILAAIAGRTTPDIYSNA